ARERRLLETVRYYPIDAPAIIAAIQIQEFLDVRGERPRVLDDLTIHVDDIQSAIRRVCKLHRPKPGVARGREFHFLLAGRALGFEAHVVRRKDFAMHQVAASVAHEGVVAKLTWECVSAINQRAGCAREVTRRTA